MNGWTGNKGEIQREKPEPTSFRRMAPIGIFWYKNVNENNSFRLRGVSCCTFAENRASQNKNFYSIILQGRHNESFEIRYIVDCFNPNFVKSAIRF